MFRIKVCGITNVRDAVAAVDAGVDAIGLNFYEKSPRCVSIAEARRISDTVNLPAGPVGVFVNHDVEQIREICSQTNLHVIQAHGDESPEALKPLAERDRVIWARRYGSDVKDVVGQLLRDVLNYATVVGHGPAALLIDAAVPGQYGGSGTTVSWDALAEYRSRLGDTPLILAGGLTPDNVAEAIRIVRPHGVDVASGVESSPGKKDPVKVRDFIAAARAAFG